MSLKSAAAAAYSSEVFGNLILSRSGCLLSIIALILSCAALFLANSTLADIERRTAINEGQIERLKEIQEGIIKYLKSGLNNEPPPTI